MFTDSDDPCDSIDIAILGGWTRLNDSNRMRKKDNGKGLEGDRRNRYQDSWIRFDINRSNK